MPRLGPGGGGGGGGGDSHVPGGDYIAAMRSFKRKVGKTSKQDYLRQRWEVCSGPLKGKSFFCNMSCDLSKNGTVQRWQIMIEACEVTEEFELGSTRDGTAEEGDRNIRRLFVDQPMKVRVKAEKNGEYTNNDLEMIHYPRNWTEQDVAAINAWIEEHDKGGSDNPEDDAGSTPPPAGDDYDDLPPARTGGHVDDADDYGDGRGGGSDDDDPIPF